MCLNPRVRLNTQPSSKHSDWGCKGAMVFEPSWSGESDNSALHTNIIINTQAVHANNCHACTRPPWVVCVCVRARCVSVCVRVCVWSSPHPPFPPPPLLWYM